MLQHTDAQTGAHTPMLRAHRRHIHLCLSLPHSLEVLERQGDRREGHVAALGMHCVWRAARHQHHAVMLAALGLTFMAAGCIWT